jgi:hypothetical protein
MPPTTRAAVPELTITSRPQAAVRVLATSTPVADTMRLGIPHMTSPIVFITTTPTASKGTPTHSHIVLSTHSHAASLIAGVSADTHTSDP